VGKTGFARAANTLRVCAVSSLRGTSKTGKLSENRRFFDKLNRRLSGGFFKYKTEPLSPM